MKLCICFAKEQKGTLTVAHLQTTFEKFHNEVKISFSISYRSTSIEMEIVAALVQHDETKMKGVKLRIITRNANTNPSGNAREEFLWILHCESLTNWHMNGFSIHGQYL